MKETIKQERVRDFGKGAEQALLIACTHPDPGRAALSGRMTLEKGHVDWDAFLDLSIRHKVYPLVFLRLKDMAGTLIPIEIIDRLRQMYLKNLTRNICFSKRLVQVYDLFAGHGIPALAFKGPVLAKDLYGDEGCRVFSDLDFLVPDKDAIRARGILVREGFTCEPPLPEKQLESYVKRENYFNIFSPGDHIGIDLHWEISSRYTKNPMTFSDFASHVKDVEIEGRRIPTIDDEMLLAYLCIHHSKHGWDQLDQVAGIAMLIERLRVMDVSRILSEAGKRGARRMLLTGMNLAGLFYGTKLPPKIEEAISHDPRMGWIIREALLHMAETRRRENWRFSKIHLVMRDNPWLAIQHALRIIFRPTVKEWMEVPLPPVLSFLYPVIRPFRLGRNYWTQRNS